MTAGLSGHVGGNGLVREYLRDRTIGCPACRYNLRGLSGDSCPECGTQLQLHLISTDVKMGWWIVRLLAVALPLGFSGILAAAAGFGAWQSTFWTESDWWTLGALCLLTLLYSLALVRIIRRRSVFLRMPVMTQRARALGLVAIMLCSQVLLLFLYQQFSR